jgi:hypothetical protein
MARNGQEPRSLLKLCKIAPKIQNKGDKNSKKQNRLSPTHALGRPRGAQLCPLGWFPRLGGFENHDFWHFFGKIMPKLQNKGPEKEEIGKVRSANNAKSGCTREASRVTPHVSQARSRRAHVNFVGIFFFLSYFLGFHYSSWGVYYGLVVMGSEGTGSYFFVYMWVVDNNNAL